MSSICFWWCILKHGESKDGTAHRGLLRQLDLHDFWSLATVAISVKMSRCQDDIFPRIELIPSFVLSSDNTNCKNDIQLFHQLFDELSVHTDYH